MAHHGIRIPQDQRLLHSGNHSDAPGTTQRHLAGSRQHSRRTSRRCRLPAPADGRARRSALPAQQMSSRACHAHSPASTSQPLHHCGENRRSPNGRNRDARAARDWSHSCTLPDANNAPNRASATAGTPDAAAGPLHRPAAGVRHRAADRPPPALSAAAAGLTACRVLPADACRPCSP